jgi:hypothetical protein
VQLPVFINNFHLIPIITLRDLQSGRRTLTQFQKGDVGFCGFECVVLGILAVDVRYFLMSFGHVSDSNIRVIRDTQRIQGSRFARGVK